MPAHRLSGETVFKGLNIAIENPKGSIRRWYDPHGKESGSTTMKWSYGYIRRTKGTDGDHVDVYLGPDAESDTAYIVDQMKKPDFKDFDEQKVMLGFRDAAAAKSAYLKQYNDPKFFGGMTAMPLKEFKAKVLDKSNHGEKISQLSHAHESGKGLSAAALQRGKRVEMEHTTNPATARQIAIDHLHERPDYYRLLAAVEKTASERTSRIADRVDDAGIALLAAPGAADLVSKTMMRGARNGKIRAAAIGLKHLAGTRSAFGKSHVRDLAGLTMVAPGITHRIARGIESVVPEKQAALVKIAARLYDDFEYKTEPEKAAILNYLVKLSGTKDAGVGDVVALGRRVLSGGKALATDAAAALRAGASRMGAKGIHVPSGISTAAPHGPIAQMPGMAQMSSGQGIHVPGTVPHAGAGNLQLAPPNWLRPEAGSPRVPTRATPGTAAVPKATAPAAAPMAPGVPETPAKAAPVLSGRNIAKGALVAGGGLATYAGYKGIQTAASVLQNPQAAMEIPSYIGQGRAF